MKVKELTIHVMTVLSVLLLIIFLLWFMLGDSPTVEQMFVVLVVPIYLFVFGIYERLNNKLMNTRENINRQLSDIKVSLAKIEGKLKL